MRSRYPSMIAISGAITISNAFMFLFALIANVQLPVYAEQSNLVLLAKSKSFIAADNKVQKFSDTIALNKGQEKLRLILVYRNGSATQPSFNWIRISSSSMSYVTEQQFKGKKVFELDVTGELGRDGNQILVTAAGQPGAVFSWEIYTIAPKVTTVHPLTVQPGGTATILGENLCPNVAAETVTINGAPAHCVSASSNSIVVQVPEELSSGEAIVKVNSAGLDAGEVACSVNAAPKLSHLSGSWVAAGNPLTIYGEGFGKDPSKIVVFIGPTQVPIDSSSPNEITVTIPGSYITAWAGFYMPVKVSVNGVKASNTLTISCAVTAPVGGVVFGP